MDIAISLALFMIFFGDGFYSRASALNRMQLFARFAISILFSFSALIVLREIGRIDQTSLALILKSFLFSLVACSSFLLGVHLKPERERPK